MRRGDAERAAAALAVVARCNDLAHYPVALADLRRFLRRHPGLRAVPAAKADLFGQPDVIEGLPGVAMAWAAGTTAAICVYVNDADAVRAVAAIADEHGLRAEVDPPGIPRLVAGATAVVLTRTGWRSSRPSRLTAMERATAALTGAPLPVPPWHGPRLTHSTLPPPDIAGQAGARAQPQDERTTHDH